MNEEPDEIVRLGSILIRRYEEDLRVYGTRDVLSNAFLPYIDKDPEAYLYCILYMRAEDRVRLYDEKKLFALRFTYPKTVKSISKTRWGE